MDLVYFGAGGFVIAVVLFKRDLLFRPETFKIILGVSAVLFTAGLVLVLIRREKIDMEGALLSPMVSVGLFWAMRKLFRLWLKRNPEDTFMNWKSGMGPDRVFNIVYFTSAFICWALITALAPKLATALP
jgi:hypothetical protein